jgi:hypothetical protein
VERTGYPRITLITTGGSGASDYHRELIVKAPYHKTVRTILHEDLGEGGSDIESVFDVVASTHDDADDDEKREYIAVAEEYGVSTQYSVEEE